MAILAESAAIEEGKSENTDIAKKDMRQSIDRGHDAHYWTARKQSTGVTDALQWSDVRFIKNILPVTRRD